MNQELLKRKHSFDELTMTCKKHYLPFLRKYISINSETRVLEIECGEGGNLLPFTEIGCDVTGIDLSGENIHRATLNLCAGHVSVKLYSASIYSVDCQEHSYDIILIHEVIERVKDKQHFLQYLKKFLDPNGIIFLGFHTWGMPYGGYQYLCKNRLAAYFPYIHLLPLKLYKPFLYYFCHEELPLVNRLTRLRKYKTTIEQIRGLLFDNDYKVRAEQIYFIEPWCEARFKLQPRKLLSLLAQIPYLRNYLSTGCFYLLGRNNYYVQFISDGKVKKTIQSSYLIS